MAKVTPGLKELVLVGGGHAHAEVLRRFGRKPPQGTRLTLVSPTRSLIHAPMLAGLVSGAYRPDRVQIDLSTLAERAGARWIAGTLESIDLVERRLRVRDHPSIPFDVLSLNAGASPRYRDIPGVPDHVLPIRPLQAFLAGWTDIRLRVAASKGRFRTIVVGAGASAVELILAMQQRLRQDMLARGDHPSRLELCLVTEAPGILPDWPEAARQRLATRLQERGIRVFTRHQVVEVRPHSLLVSHEPEMAADAIVWAAPPEGPQWARESGLRTDGNGLVEVGPDLQSVSHLGIFVAGELAALPSSMQGSAVEPVGQGQLLACNLRAALEQRTPFHFRPGKQRLRWIFAGYRSSAVVWGSRLFEGRWVDWIKRRRDAKFVRRYRLPRWSALRRRNPLAKD